MSHNPPILSEHLEFESARGAMLRAFETLCRRGTGVASDEIRATASAMRQIAILREIETEPSGAANTAPAPDPIRQGGRING